MDYNLVSTVTVTMAIILTAEDFEADMEKITSIGKISQVRMVLLLILSREGYNFLSLNLKIDRIKK